MSHSYNSVPLSGQEPKHSANPPVNPSFAEALEKAKLIAAQLGIQANNKVIPPAENIPIYNNQSQYKESGYKPEPYKDVEKKHSSRSHNSRDKDYRSENQPELNRRERDYDSRERGYNKRDDYDNRNESRGSYRKHSNRNDRDYDKNRLRHREDRNYIEEDRGDRRRRNGQEDEDQSRRSLKYGGSREIVHEDFGIPSRLVGLVIGRSGETVKRIQSTSGATLNIDHDASTLDGSKRTTLVGTKEQVRMARSLINEVLMNSPDAKQNSEYHYPQFDSMDIKKVEYPIPNTKVGLIIGKGGETIKDLASRSNTKVSVEGDNFHQASNPNRIVFIEGTDEGISAAKLIIDSLTGANNTSFNSNMGQNPRSVVVQIPSEHLGLIIGKGGESIKLINQISTAKVVIDRGLGLPSGAQRDVTITGSTASIEHAKNLIYEKIKHLDPDFSFPPDAIQPTNTDTLGFEHLGYASEYTEQMYAAYAQQNLQYYSQQPPGEAVNIQQQLNTNEMDPSQIAAAYGMTTEQYAEYVKQYYEYYQQNSDHNVPPPPVSNDAEDGKPT